MPRKFLIIDHIRSIHNVGCMFRTADGAGFDEIIICGYSPQPTDPRMNKVALGAEQSVPWRHVPDTVTLCEQLRADGVELIALETGKRAISLPTARPRGGDCALIVGHEVDGVQQSVLDLCDQIWQIPMVGIKASLNVSVAAGIGMYHLCNNYDD